MGDRVFRRGTPMRWDGLDYAIKVMNQKQDSKGKENHILNKYTGKSAVTPAKSRKKAGLAAAVKEQPQKSGAELAREEMLSRMLSKDVLNPENQYQAPVTPQKAYEHMTSTAGAKGARERMLKRHGLK